MLGTTWEFAFDVLGDSFCTILCKPLLYIPGTRGIAHSIHDGVLFSIGVLLVRDLCEKPLSRFSWTELMIMLLWGNLQEIVVDLVGNGWIWRYHEDHWANGVMFYYKGIGYTLVP